MNKSAILFAWHNLHEKCSIYMYLYFLIFAALSVCEQGKNNRIKLCLVIGQYAVCGSQYVHFNHTPVVTSCKNNACSVFALQVCLCSAHGSTLCNQINSKGCRHGKSFVFT